MSEFEHEYIQYLLKSRAANYDLSNFRKYAKGEITLEECKKRFALYNKVDEETMKKFRDDLFVEWLASLGWFRHDREANTDI